MNKFIVVKDTLKKVKRFNVVGRTVEFKIKPVPSDENPEKWIKDAVGQALSHATQQLDPQDYVGVNLCSKDFKKGDAWVSFRTANQLSVEDIWSLLSKIYQSNGEALNTETFCLGITSVKLPVGEGNQRGRNYNTFEEECNKRIGIITISNSDNLCLPRALVVAIAYAMKNPLAKKIRKNTEKLQDIKTQKLILDAGISIPEEGGGIHELREFQKYLTGFNITVFAYGSKGRDVIFNGENKEAKYNIYLIHNDNHFNVITSLTSAFCCGYYCDICFKPYNNKNSHRCTKACPCCRQVPTCLRKGKELMCEDCNRRFRSDVCFNKHMSKMGDADSVCETIRRCKTCLKTIPRSRDHVCGEVFCKICSDYRPENHYCFQKVNEREPNTKGVLFIFYDLETRQERPVDDSSSTIHVPNLCVFQYKCSECIQESPTDMCSKCLGEVKIIRQKPLNRFMEFILGIRKAFKKVIVLAHNGQAYDHQFLLKYILDHTDIKPELIMRGTKILLMELQNVRFIDSLNYFPMPLSALPKAFELGSELRKGYFPYLFNTTENEKAKLDCLPDLRYYDPDNMMPEKRIEFLRWYEEHRNDSFDMERDLVEYCKSDVDILAKACIKFRKLFLEECNVCPFTEACTIASACSLVYRRNFLQPETIGIVPRGGYRNTNNQSKGAISWMIWEEKQRGINIINAAKQREEIIEGVKVDGYCKETNQLYQYHGCYWHGHPCVTVDRNKPLHEDSEDTMELRYERTLETTERLRKLGYEVIEMWECDFRRMMKENKEIEALTQFHPLLAYIPLNPRDAFYGGRTENMKLYYKCKPGEKIKYVDVRSLYPYVCKYGKFPIGHPVVYVGDDCKQLDLNQTDGLIKCKILPPENLSLPVLPFRANNRLIFALCKQCTLERRQSECNHSDEERTITGTWVMDEILKALQLGYRIVEIYEIWKYTVVQYDGIRKYGGLFTEMMNKFLKIKQEASGWPKDCITQEQRGAYIDSFLSHEGIQLEFSKIIKNEGLRSLAKLMLNSFWGKYAQRSDLIRTCIIDQPYELFNLLTSPSVEVQTIKIIDETKLIVCWNYKNEAIDLHPFVSVPIACYTTAQARLKLYSYLEKLQDRVLYCDTG